MLHDPKGLWGKELWSVHRKGSIWEALPGLLLAKRLQINGPRQQAQACFPFGVLVSQRHK